MSFALTMSIRTARSVGNRNIPFYNRWYRPDFSSCNAYFLPWVWIKLKNCIEIAVICSLFILTEIAVEYFTRFVLYITTFFLTACVHSVKWEKTLGFVVFKFPERFYSKCIYW